MVRRGELDARLVAARYFTTRSLHKSTGGASNRATWGDYSLSSRRGRLDPTGCAGRWGHSPRYHWCVTKREQREAAERIGRLLATVDRGELACPRSLVTRLDGARVALAALGARGGKPGDE